MEKVSRNYTLPHESPVIAPLIALADDANRQAAAADEYIAASIRINCDVQENLLPQLPDFRSAYSTSVIKEYEALYGAIVSASDAHTSEADALNSAISISRDLLEKQEFRVQSLTDDIAKANAEAVKIKEAIAQPQVSLHSEEFRNYAKALQDNLEATSEKYRQLKNCKTLLNENKANIEYMVPLHEAAKAHLDELTKAREQMTENLKRINMYFGNLPDDTDDKSIIAAGEEAAADTAEDTGKGEKQSVPAVIWTYLKVLLVALLLAFFLRAYVFDITQVQGLSMYDTLNDGDMLVTSRISYILGEPQRGDIVVLNAPDSPGEDYVKRVIAMPNEQLDIEGGLVYIDGKLLPENYLDGVFTDGDIHMVIPDGYYFVMGDNRGVSRDSREESVGVISGDNIHGKAVFRFWPFKTIGGLK